MCSNLFAIIKLYNFLCILKLTFSHTLFIFFYKLEHIELSKGVQNLWLWQDFLEISVHASHQYLWYNNKNDSFKANQIDLFKYLWNKLDNLIESSFFFFVKKAFLPFIVLVSRID
jgi:hypothetical protein